MTIELDNLRELYVNNIELKELYYVSSNTLIWRLTNVPAKIYNDSYYYDYIYY